MAWIQKKQGNRVPAFKDASCRQPQPRPKERSPRALPELKEGKKCDESGMRGGGRTEEQENLPGRSGAAHFRIQQVFSEHARRGRFAGEGPSMHKGTWGPRGAGNFRSTADLPVKHFGEGREWGLAREHCSLSVSVKEHTKCDHTRYYRENIL